MTERVCLFFFLSVTLRYVSGHQKSRALNWGNLALYILCSSPCHRSNTTSEGLLWPSWLKFPSLPFTIILFYFLHNIYHNWIGFFFFLLYFSLFVCSSSRLLDPGKLAPFLFGTPSPLGIGGWYTCYSFVLLILFWKEYTFLSRALLVPVCMSLSLHNWI